MITKNIREPINQMKKNNLPLLTAAALFTALLCIASPFTIPIGAIPISLATFAVYLASAVLGWKWGCAAVLCYMVLGICGLPVFSGFGSGLGQFVAPTGGFLAGYLPCAFLCGLAADRAKKHRLPVLLLGMVSGTVVCYGCGLAWYTFLTGQTILQGLAVCVLPFLFGDSLKIIGAALLADLLHRRRIGR